MASAIEGPDSLVRLGGDPSDCRILYKRPQLGLQESEGIGICSGFLTARRVVRTAKHCVRGVKFDDITVQCGFTGLKTHFRSDDYEVHPSGTTLLTSAAEFRETHQVIDIRYESTSVDAVKLILKDASSIDPSPVSSLVDFLGEGPAEDTATVKQERCSLSGFGKRNNTSGALYSTDFFDMEFYISSHQEYEEFYSMTPVQDQLLPGERLPLQGLPKYLPQNDSLSINIGDSGSALRCLDNNGEAIVVGIHTGFNSFGLSHNGPAKWIRTYAHNPFPKVQEPASKSNPLFSDDPVRDFFMLFKNYESSEAEEFPHQR